MAHGKPKQTAIRRRSTAIVGVMLAAVGLCAALVIWLRSRRQRAAKSGPSTAPLVQSISGLSSSEAEARRRQGQNTELKATPRRTRQQIIRDSAFTIFNLNLTVLAVVQLMLGKPLDALITLGVMALNIGVNVFQVEFAERRLRSVQALTRSQTTVIRDGVAQSIDPAEVVAGDILAIAAGDQITVDGVIVGDGRILVDESSVTGDSTQVEKRPGDHVYAGSVCTGGRAACRAEQIGDDRRIAKHLQDFSASKEQLTPIERILDRIMRVLLVVVLLFGLLLVVFYFVRDPNLDADKFADYVSVIFGIAPASLFFMVILTYIAATADLAAKGALVQQARSVESVAQTNVLCFAKAGILTGANMEMTPISAARQATPISERRIRRILGDFAASSAVNNLTMQTMASTFPGSKRRVKEEAPFMSVYGWSALVFADPDLQGVYVLAEPGMISLASENERDEKAPGKQESAGDQTSVSQRILSLSGRFGRLLRRDDSSNDAEHTSDETRIPPPPEDNTVKFEQDEADLGVFGRFRNRLDAMLDVVEVRPELETERHLSPEREAGLVFAYSPQPTSLHSDDGEPTLPSDLIPLCVLSIQEQVRPDVILAMKEFADRGVDLKVFTPDPPQKTVDLLSKSGLETGAELAARTITGTELAAVPAQALAEVAERTTIFGQCTIRQMELIVQALRAEGRSVALIGDRVSDITAMHAANLAVARRSAYPAVFNSADIVLLGDSPRVLSAVVDRGQRIVNGLMDILKLNLTQVLYMLLLVVGVPLFARGFPMTGSQAGIIAFITIALPALGLTLWADSGAQPTENLRRLLVRFVTPAAVTMAFTALIIFLLFKNRSGDLSYAQVGLMHTLVAMGLLLIVFIKPPLKLRFWGPPALGDLRPTLLAMVGALIFLAITQIPLLSDLLNIEPLQRRSHYLLVAQATLAWAIAVQFIWLLVPVDRKRARVIQRQADARSA